MVQYPAKYDDPLDGSTDIHRNGPVAISMATIVARR